jgi:hypothetical protein
MRHAESGGHGRCGLCRKVLQPFDSISVTGVGERCYRCFNGETAERLGVDFDNTPIDPVVVSDIDGVPHTFEIRSMLVATGHAMYARERQRRDERGGYRFEILGDFEVDARELFKQLHARIQQGLSVRYVRKTEHGWQLTQDHRLRGVIEWDPDVNGATPLVVIDGRSFTWDQVGRMLMTFEGFTLNATIEDTMDVVGGPLADSLAESLPAVDPPAPSAVVLRGPSSKPKPVARRKPRRAWPPSPKRLEVLIEEATVDAYTESEQAVGLLTAMEEHLALPFEATLLGVPVIVERLDVNGSDQIVAVCRKGPKRQKVHLIEIELTQARPNGAEWIAAYRRWARTR